MTDSGPGPRDQSPASGDPWPSYPSQAQPPGYGSAGSYPSANDPYAQPPSYGQPPPYYQQPVYLGNPPPSHPQATTALILGIVGVAVCPFVGIGGFVVGRRVRAEIDAAPAQWGGRGMATAGWVLGIISIVYSALALLYGVVMIVAVAAGMITS